MIASGFVLIICLASASAFSYPATSNTFNQRVSTTTSLLGSVVSPNGECSRNAFLSSAFAAMAATSALAFPSIAIAADDTITSSTNRSIKACEVNDDCVSTANIRDAKGSYR